MAIGAIPCNPRQLRYTDRVLMVSSLDDLIEWKRKETVRRNTHQSASYLTRGSRRQDKARPPRIDLPGELVCFVCFVGLRDPGFRQTSIKMVTNPQHQNQYACATTSHSVREFRTRYVRDTTSIIILAKKMSDRGNSRPVTMKRLNAAANPSPWITYRHLGIENFSNPFSNLDRYCMTLLGCILEP